MKGKVVVVTGATNGIGEVAALELARMGAAVALVSRSQTKLDQSAAKIRQQTGNQNVTTIQADLSSIQQMNAAADEVLKRFDRLDVLLNNAGAFYDSRQVSVDGLEMTFALNHMSYFVLTNRLLDLLKKTANQQGEARVVNVSSNAHRMGKVYFDDLQLEKRYTGWDAYGSSKMMNVLFTYELARRLQGTGVAANSLHPGFVNTGFGLNTGGFIRFSMSLLQKAFAKSPEKGAETSIYLAASPEVRGITGKYWSDKKQVASHPYSMEREHQERLWQVSEKLLR
jgi:NAD(P)-dependent dehydrogenase (short-subunit alcohol dehydrogenase family)